MMIKKKKYLTLSFNYGLAIIIFIIIFFIFFKNIFLNKESLIRKDPIDGIEIQYLNRESNPINIDDLGLGNLNAATIKNLNLSLTFTLLNFNLSIIYYYDFDDDLNQLFVKNKNEYLGFYDPKLNNEYLFQIYFKIMSNDTTINKLKLFKEIDIINGSFIIDDHLNLNISIENNFRNIIYVKNNQINLPYNQVIQVKPLIPS